MGAKGQRISANSARAKAKAATRAVIIASARKLFERDGYHATGIRDIAADIGMTTGAISGNFAGKDELYAAVYGHPPVTPEEGRRLLQELIAVRQQQKPRAA